MAATASALEVEHGWANDENDDTTHTITLKVTGMMCQKSCGTTVENALRMLPGVISANASFADKRATVTAELKANDDDYFENEFAQQAVDAIECVGFDAEIINDSSVMNSHTVQLVVTGMMCQKSCGTTVENALQTLPGVTFAEASFETSSATITADLDAYQKVNQNAAKEILIKRLEEEAIDAVECVGFDARLLQPNEELLPLSPPNEMEEPNLEEPLLMEEQQPPLDKPGASLQVGGMSCAVCSGRVERALLSVDGVEQANVTLAMNRARVVFGSHEEHHLQDLVQECVTAVQKGGYDCDLIQILDHNNTTSVTQGVSLTENAARMEQARKQELQSWKRLLVAAVVLTVPIMVIHYSQMHDDNDMSSSCLTRKDTIIFLLATPVQFGVGRRYYQAAFKAWPTMGMDALVIMGTTASYVYSLAVYGILLVSSSTNLQPTFETGAMLIMFVTFGKFLEAYAKGKTASALQTLMELQPVFASRVIAKQKDYDDNVDISSLETENVQMDQVLIGDYLVVMPGARIPTDGILVSASQHKEAYIDESALSGEPFPVSKKAGDPVFGSTVNQLSVLLVKVTATGSGTMLAKIVKLVEDAQSSKAPIQAQADAIACVFAPTVMVLALVTFVGWMVFVKGSLEERFFLALTSAISVIVVACPCALGLATPTAVMVGTGVGATNGLLIKGGAVLESAHKVDTIVLDKTGTITSGRAVLSNHVEFVKDMTDPLLQGLPTNIPKDHLALWSAACAERQSEHPLAKAIVNAASSIWGGDVTCSQQGVSVTDFAVLPGCGVECVIHKEGWGVWCVRVGNNKFANEDPRYETDGSDENVSVDDLDESVGDAEVMDLRRRGQIGVYVSVLCRTSEAQDSSRRVVGVLGIVDPIVPEAQSTVAALRRMGLDVWMCTGDHELTATSVARQVGIDDENVCSNVKPEGKADLVTRLQKKQRNTSLTRRLGKRRQNGLVAVVGDGINDAVALARADVGVAIGAGTQVAVEAADVVLVRSSLHDVVVALHLSRVVFHRIRLNFVWAMGYNLCALPFAAGALYPITSWRLPPEFAGLMMAFSSVSVVTSSLLLRTYSRPMIQEDGKLKGAGFVEPLCNNCSKAVASLANFIISHFTQSEIEYDSLDASCSSDDDSNIELV